MHSTRLESDQHFMEEREDILAARQREFTHLKDITYLDHAGATLYSTDQLEAYFSDLSSHLYGNPHSGNPSSKLSSDMIEQTRERISNHFNTSLSHYDVVFTPGCTGALKLLAETFPWTANQKAEICRHQNLSTEELNESNQVEVKYLPGQRHPDPPSSSLTSGAPGSLKTIDTDSVADTVSSSHDTVSVPYSSSCVDGSVFCYLEDNHTSVVGMRETAVSNGASIVCTTDTNLLSSPKSEEINSTSIRDNAANVSEELKAPFHLFAYPAQSNFCGRKYPLTWVKELPGNLLEHVSFRSGTWLVALDAASLVSSSSLDLSSCPAHFVSISFYKMFGFPTGLGALLVRRDCCGLLRKGYYGGGTVAATMSRERFHVPRKELHERLEDGTVSFLSIAALTHGFDALYRIGKSMEDVSRHTFSLAQYVYTSLSQLHHANGQPVCILYCNSNFTDLTLQGPIVNFNLLRSDGCIVGYSEVDKLASVYNIHLRTGCFCNTGACMSYLGMSAERVKDHLKAGHVCGDTMDLVNGQPTGSVRVSVGYMSTLADVEAFVRFVETCFVDKDISTAQTKSKHTNSVSSPAPIVTDNHVIVDHCSVWMRVGDHIQASSGGDDPFKSVGHLSHLMLYPIKSCGSQSVSSWPLGEKGLLYDREWMIVSGRGSVLSQKQEGRLCLIRPVVDLEAGTLTLTAQGYHSLTIPLSTDPGLQSDCVNTRVCGDRVAGLNCGEEAARWLTQVLNRQCLLLRQNPDVHRISQEQINKRSTSLSLANVSQYLLITENSVEHLCAALEDDGTRVKLNTPNCLIRFRPNFVVGRIDHTHSRDYEGVGLVPYEEEDWRRVKIGLACFDMSGQCSRCQMVCMDPDSGDRSPEPLKTLMKLRGSKVPFGVYLTRLAISKH